jgi:hypothetical protein
VQLHNTDNPAAIHTTWTFYLWGDSDDFAHASAAIKPTCANESWRPGCEISTSREG